MGDSNFCRSCGTATYTAAPPEAPKKSNAKVIIALVIAAIVVVVSIAGAAYYIIDTDNKNSAHVTINVYPSVTVTNVSIHIDGEFVGSYTGVVYDWEFVYITEKIRFSANENVKTITVTATSGLLTDTETITIEKGGRYTVDLHL
jgi:flagellar basal body-associated protein FliL